MEIDLNMEEIRERASRVISGVTAGMDGPAAADPPLAMAVLEDQHLSLFLILASDFLCSVPTAVIDHVTIIHDDGTAEKPEQGSRVSVKLPLAEMFDGFCQMRARQWAGEGIDDTFSVYNRGNADGTP